MGSKPLSLLDIQDIYASGKRTQSLSHHCQYYLEEGKYFGCSKVLLVSQCIHTYSVTEPLPWRSCLEVGPVSVAPV